MVFAPQLGGRVLYQKQLARLFANQQAGKMTTAAQQRNLRRTFLHNVAKNHPAGVPEMLFDLTNPEAQTVTLDTELLEAYRIGQYLEAFEVLAPKATAGLRETFDIVNWNNPNFMYNPVFLTLLVKAEARFIKELHAEKAQLLKGMDLSAKAAEIEKALPAKTIQVVQEIFGNRSLVQTLELLRDKPMKVIGKEVRPQTDQMVELEARLTAAEDITVITSKKFTDSTNIYLTSFMCFLLGSDGGNYYSPSHSPVYVLGRKALAKDGAQLLPKVYNRFIVLLKEIYQEAVTRGHEINIAARSSPNILKTLSYDRIATLFMQVMNPNPNTIAEINKAAKDGLRIILNTLSGSAAKSLAAQFKAFGINPKIFVPLWKAENSYFEAGYGVIKKDGRYLADHFGVDTTAREVLRQIPYAEKLKDVKIGTMVYECDPDNDRFVVKQVLSEKSAALCETFGIDYIKIGKGRILAAPSPNKTFLLLDIADYERMKASGEWEKYQFLYFPTYVSTAAWQEFARYVEKTEGNMSTFLCRVGFKNFNQALAEIQEWWFNRPNEPTLSIKPQLGELLTLDRARMLRVLSKEEESGGRTAGFPAEITNILGGKILSLPEKATGDALMAHLADMAARYNAGQEMELPKVIKAAFVKYGLVSRIDARLDILHGDQGVIAQVGPEEAINLKADAGAQKSNFNTFFFSIAKAVQGKKLTLDKAKAILSIVMPQWADTWHCLDSMLFVEEELTPGVFRSEGVPMTFSPRDGKTPMVTMFKFRPSGTDPLKSKVYIDAEVLGPEQIVAIKSVFDVLKTKDLYSVLDAYGIKYADPRPAGTDQIGLEQII